MSTRLLLDGQDLRTLMLRVREEMGPDAKIVRAERVRTGGIAGFFAREHYELTVEVPDAPRRRVARSRPAPADDVGRPTGTTAEPVGLDALMAAADALESAPEVSTTGPAFAEVLASVQRVTADPAPAQAEPDEPTEAGADEPEPPAWTPAPAPPRLTRAGMPEVAAGADASLAEQPAAPPADEAAAPEPVEPEPSEPVDEPEPVQPATPDAEPAEDLDDTSRPGTSVAALLELGIPLRLLAGFDDPRASVPLSVLVRTFDRPRGVRLAPGAVVVVAGPAELAVRTAVAMAHRAGLAAHEVVLAGDVDPLPGHGRRVQTVSAAARVRERVPEDAPMIVALGVGGTASAAELLAAFEPDEAWAAVDARLRGVELRRWLRSVGARRGFDAVAASHTFEAQAPGTVLNLGVPVGWLDGLPASPVVWAAVLSERLDDDARWD
jgi:hypothetical protein